MNPSRDRILIVEDEQIVALDLKGMLEEMNYEVVGLAASAAEAVACARTTKPDLVLMDINLDGKEDGIDAARQIKSECGIPIIFVTAYDDERTLVRAQITEPYGYILKPYQARELRASIKMAQFHHLMQRERERMTRELEAALTENRILQGLLTTCCQCHKIRDGNDGWVTLETYVQRHTALKFSHGYCPDCERAAVAQIKRELGR